MKQIYRDHERKVSDGSTDIDLELRRFPRLKQGVLRYLTVEDETTICDRVQIGIKKGSIIDWIADKVSPQAGTKYWTGDDIPIESQEIPIVRFTGTTSGDVLTVTCRGWIWDVKEGSSYA